MIALLLSSSVALAHSPAQASEQTGWQCGSIRDLPVVVLRDGDALVNNVRLRQEMGFLSERPYAELSLTVVNGAAEPIFTTVQFLGFGADSTLPILAASAEPIMGMVAGDTTEQMTASVNITPGDLQAISRYCLKING